MFQAKIEIKQEAPAATSAVDVPRSVSGARDRRSVVGLGVVLDRRSWPQLSGASTSHLDGPDLDYHLSATAGTFTSRSGNGDRPSEKTHRHTSPSLTTCVAVCRECDRGRHGSIRWGGLARAAKRHQLLSTSSLPSVRNRQSSIRRSPRARSSLP